MVPQPSFRFRGPVSPQIGGLPPGMKVGLRSNVLSLACRIVFFVRDTLGTHLRVSLGPSWGLFSPRRQLPQIPVALADTAVPTHCYLQRKIMKSKVFHAVLASAALLISATAAVAAPSPVAGIDVKMDCSPSPQQKCPIDQGKTDDKGQVRLKAGLPGSYEIVLDGKSLVTAVDKRSVGKGGTITVTVSSDSGQLASQTIRYVRDTAAQGLRIRVVLPSTATMGRYIFAGVTLDF